MAMTIPNAIVKQLNNLPIEEVAERLGITINRHSALCFMHDDHTPSLKFSVGKNLFHCFVCGKGGGPIKLVQEFKAWKFQDACVWLAGQFNIWRPSEGTNKKSVKRAIRKSFLATNNDSSLEFDEEVFSWLINTAKLSPEASKFLFEERHFKEEVIRKLSVGSLSYPKRFVCTMLKQFGKERCLRSKIVRQGKYGLYSFFYTPCLLFPYYCEDGRLVGMQSRYLGENIKVPRFQFLSSAKTRLFNLPILNKLKNGDKLYISEGITDCLAMLSAGMDSVAIPSATILPREDLVMLKKFDLRMYPDQDEAGFRAFKELRRFFINHYSTIRAEKLPDGVKDFCDYYVKSKESEGNNGIYL